VLIRSSAVLLLLGLVVGAQEGWNEEDPKAKAAYEKALSLQERGKWGAARKAFRKFMDRYPDSILVADANIRGGDNAYLGAEVLWRGGPPERRIDVAVMGDGFTVDGADQRKQEEWAKLCVKVLFNEKALDEYRTYFNIYFVRLASLEEGVDPNLSPEQRARIEERNRTRSKSRRKKTDFNTALDCKAAGPQGQVMADRRLVFRWLDYAQEKLPGCGDDRLVIAFARFGRLGMGGGGIANVGRPDKSITTHEFGHAFSRLLDEYTGNPDPPPPHHGRFYSAANASLSPDPEKVPWAHMLKARVKGVGIYEGGATYTKGVWRPAPSCVMNAAGNTQFCPVCREQSIRVIYEYVNPIDAMGPDPAKTITIVQGELLALSVTPMQPKRHKLEVAWYVAPWQETVPEAPPVEATEDQDPSEDDIYGELIPDDAPGAYQFSLEAGRAAEDRSRYEDPPRGEASKLGKWVKGKPPRHVFPLGELPAGKWQVTAQVADRTPWVIKDDKHLLEERATWFVTVEAGS
jgi:hypothetical protein